jgi:hypothetical protein
MIVKMLQLFCCLDMKVAVASYRYVVEQQTCDSPFSFVYLYSRRMGDLNWIIKDKILAFAGPSAERHVSPGDTAWHPPTTFPLSSKKMSIVVRLNKGLQRGGFH